MKPILFMENSKEFTTNGIGRLSDAVSCFITEERNGQYELEMEYPVSGQHYDDIGLRKIIYAQPAVDKPPQPFRIYRMGKPMKGIVKICAQHISYDLAKNTAMPFKVEASVTAAQDTLDGLNTNAVEETGFTFETDVTTNASYSQNVPASIRSRLGGVEGSVLDQFGGEYEFDLFNVILHKQRGSDNGVTLRYGKNITDLSQEENITNTVTGIVPYWSDMDGKEVVTLPEKAVYSAYADRYSQKLTVPLDMSGDYKEAPTEDTLRAAAQAYVAQHSLGVPSASIEVSFIDLRDTAGYEDIKDLETVHLCDTVTVQFAPLGIDTKAKVVKCEYDVLAERYTKITVGSIRSSLATTITEQNARTTSAMEKQKTQTGNAINKATSWLLSGDGYIVAVKGDNGEWKELLAMDTPDIETAKKVMRLNENGLGGSSNGIDGPYEAAILVDGTIVANAIKAGILTDLNGKFYLNMETGELVMKDGTFTGTIRGSIIYFGKNDHVGRMYYNEYVFDSETFYDVTISGQNAGLVLESDKYVELAAPTVSIRARQGDNFNLFRVSPTEVYASAPINAPGGITGNVTGNVTGKASGNAEAITPGIGIQYYNYNGEKYLYVYVNGSQVGGVKLS